MKKFLFILCIFIFTLNLVSANRFWDHKRNYSQVVTVESIVSYSPSVVNYRYRDGSYDNGYYFSDCAQWTHVFNFFPVYQCGIILNYRWTWVLQSFVFNNMFRILGFNFDVGNLSFRVSTMDIGYSWYKYEWNKKITNRNNQWCLLLSPITGSIAYRIMLNKHVDIMIDLGYSMQMIINNKIIFPNTDIDASMFLENVFNMGMGFRFYTKNFKE